LIVLSLFLHVFAHLSGGTLNLLEFSLQAFQDEENEGGCQGFDQRLWGCA
jgi:hypothetical protein